MTPIPFARLAAIALTNVQREYPYRPELWLAADADLVAPRILHPLYHTSYDWHSCVHMHWSLARLLRLGRERLDAVAIIGHFDARFTRPAIQGELDFIEAPAHAGFERPYGWGWLLQLQAELVRLARTEAAATVWVADHEPLADRYALRLLDHLPRLDWPIRTGTHSNTAFACVLALDYARTVGHHALEQRIVERAHHWFGRDQRYPAHYEPGGEDFLSAGLVEAVLMREVLDGCDFADWWHAFAPAHDMLARWLEPVRVTDPGDARLVHLHGLNLVRVWCWRRLSPDLPAALRSVVEQAIEAHWLASVAAVTDGDYGATHWLASFALLAAGDET
ncbi:MAG: DUF2891 domain-containing protein [Proteobacteria bacterium]|nr:DUF2891 domain-containing protein [Burkholderiales bacterium]